MVEGKGSWLPTSLLILRNISPEGTCEGVVPVQPVPLVRPSPSKPMSQVQVASREGAALSSQVAFA